MEAHISVKKSNFLLDICAIMLIQGDNILVLNLKLSKVLSYIRAAENLYTDHTCTDPFTNKANKTNYPKNIIKALSKYQKTDN